MEQGGNTRVNAFFEARDAWSDDNIEKPNASADMELRKQFIFRKYEQRQFYQHGVEIPPSPPPPPPCRRKTREDRPVGDVCCVK
jgi:hypothetical protein